MSNLKTGDVILIEGRDLGALIVKAGNWWTRLFRNGQEMVFTHVGIMASPTEIAEAVSGGVKIVPMHYKNYFAFRQDLTEEQLTRVKGAINSFVGQKYSMWSNFIIGVTKLIRLEDWMQGIGHKGLNCSQFVARCYRAIGYTFNDQGLDLVDPADIGYRCLNSSEWQQVL